MIYDKEDHGKCDSKPLGLGLPHSLTNHDKPICVFFPQALGESTEKSVLGDSIFGIQ